MEHVLGGHQADAFLALQKVWAQIFRTRVHGPAVCAGSLVLLGASLGGLWFGGSSDKIVSQPCLCQCECKTERSGSFSWSLNSSIILILCLLVITLGISRWYQLHSGQVVSEAKGKGKKGVLGVQAALTLK